MCGICGIINLNGQPVNEPVIRQMMAVQKHRGPDDEGVYMENNIGLGFVRLSILDLSPAGHQPMFSADGRYVVVYNGEIFNYIELRDELKTHGYSFKTGTDTEVLLAAYLKWGEGCLDRFNGMWAFVIYDRDDKRIFASRDRYGIKPFYYYQTDNLFAFASEIPPLLCLMHGKPVPDYQSIFDYLVFNRSDQTANTFFKHIQKLQHGHNLSIASKTENSNYKITISPWYILRERVFNTIGFNSPNSFKELFAKSIDIRLRSDVPVGVCLSGGLDSSSIVSVLISNFKREDLNTFSAIYQPGQVGDESAFINEYAGYVNNMHYITPTEVSLYADLQRFVKAHAEPIPSTSPYAQYKVMELAAKHVVVTLDGQGADEMLAGYHYFYGYFFKELLTQWRLGLLSRELFQYLSIHKSFFGIKTFAYFMLPATWRTSARVAEKGYLDMGFVYQYQQTNAIVGGLYNSATLHEALIDHFEYKLEHLLKWEDRNSMNFSIEARVPFLDHLLVEQALSPNGAPMIANGWTKSPLRQAMMGTVPEKIRMRRDKIGFGTPQDEWFRKEIFQKLIKNIISSDRFRNRGIFDNNAVHNLYHKHLAKKKNAAKEIWKWIHLELWFRQFID